MLELSYVLAMMPPSGGEGGGGMVQMLVFFGVMILIMYFLMIRPQVKRQKEHQKMMQALKKGDKVITSSGIHGTITAVDEKTIEVQIADNTKVRFEKASVTSKKD